MRYAIALLIVASFPAPALRAADAPAPNVVIILSDDQGWGDYSFMDHPTIRTPALDKLASQSLVFTRGYVPTSLCRPSLATIITGLYPHQHGITGNDPDKPLPKHAFDARRREMVAMFEKSAALPELLKKKGYVSYQSGKWWEGVPATAGFDEAMSHGDTTRGGRHGDEGLEIGRQTMKPILDFVDRSVAAGKPFLAWYAPMLPHYPHNPPQRLLDKYIAPERPIELARYFAMCEWFDETCGQLLDHLDKKGIADNTIVVYVTDNGWVQNTQPHPAFGGPRGKQSPYDGGIRTPIMVRWPRRVKPQVNENTLAGSIDIAPTLLAACGLAPTPNMTGLNLLEPSSLQSRDTLFGEIYTHDVRELGNPDASLRFRWGIEKNWKLILPSVAHEPDTVVELFDLAADPYEKNNLAAQHTDRVKHLTRLIEQWWRN